LEPYVAKSAKAYFNGVADYSSKSAHRLREKYLPNAGGGGMARELAAQDSECTTDINGKFPLP
jgi:hypothetical protein